MNNISYWRNSLLYKKTELISKCRHSQYGAKDWRQLNCNLDFNIRGYIYYIYTWLIKSKAAKLQNVHVLERNLNISFSMSLQNIYIYIYIFIYLRSRITGLQGKGEGISLNPHYHFHLLRKHLDISRAITAESSPLHIASDRTQAGNLWFPSASR